VSQSAEAPVDVAPQLEQLGFEVDRNGAVTVHVRRPGHLFGLTLLQALRRIDEFKEPDRARILRALPDFYDAPACGAVCPACGRRHATCAEPRDQVGARASAPRTNKSKITVKEPT
jgi:hypothetical protein